MRGTKNPDLAAVAALRPDLVVANKEENRELDVRRMRERGIPVWVTDIETVPRRGRVDAPAAAGGAGLGEDPAWLVEAEAAWCGPVPAASRARRSCRSGATRGWSWGGRRSPPTCSPGPGSRCRPRGCRGRYPAVDLVALDDPAVADLVLLPDEPYVFTAGDGPEAFRRLPTRLVSGRLLTWYGPALVDARISLDRS